MTYVHIFSDTQLNFLERKLLYDDQICSKYTRNCYIRFNFTEIHKVCMKITEKRKNLLVLNCKM